MKYVIFTCVVLVFCSCGYDSGRTDPGEVNGADTIHYLVPYDSIGIDIGDSCYVFGNIWGRCTFPDGTIGVLDRSITTVKFYTPEGEYIREFNPVGTGPGEFLGIDRLGCDEYGNIMLASFYDMKLAWFDPELSLIEEVMFTSRNRGGPMRVYPVPDTGFVVLSSIFQVPDSAGCEVALFRGSDEPETVYRKRLAIFDQMGEYQIATRMIFTTDRYGRVYIADSSEDTFNIVCYSPEGDTLYCIDQPYEPVRRSQEEIDNEFERARQNWIDATGTAAGFDWEPPGYHLSIQSMMVDGIGRLWVKGGGVDAPYHVFSETGEYLHDCMMAMPDWQDVDNWVVHIGPYGIIANTDDPEQYPVLYMLEEVIEVVSSSE
ncbi:MAG: hypothetical protein KAW14_11225 [Candidatus Aegiribacteria sp.]|nr:hypothetical protein [Candidatus Aegiribacteria sp.]